MLPKIVDFLLYPLTTKDIIKIDDIVLSLFAKDPDKYLQHVEKDIKIILKIL